MGRDIDVRVVRKYKDGSIKELNKLICVNWLTEVYEDMESFDSCENDIKKEYKTNYSELITMSDERLKDFIVDYKAKVEEAKADYDFANKAYMGYCASGNYNEEMEDTLKSNVHYAKGNVSEYEENLKFFEKVKSYFEMVSNYTYVDNRDYNGFTDYLVIEMSW